VDTASARADGAAGEKRASDLLDPFVGGTEHNIAGAFAEARDTGAYLAFDEADGLLLERADGILLLLLLRPPPNPLTPPRRDVRNLP